MNFTKLPLKGAFIINLKPHKDSRGFFSRIFCQKEFKQRKLMSSLVQISFAKNNKKGQIRGMHYQEPPYQETKIVRCIRGSFKDVIIDIRKESDTYNQWHSEILKSSEFKMIYIPKGFAHGYKTLEDNTELIYMMDQFYNKSYAKELSYKTYKFFDK